MNATKTKRAKWHRVDLFALLGNARAAIEHMTDDDVWCAHHHVSERLRQIPGLVEEAHERAIQAEVRIKEVAG